MSIAAEYILCAKTARRGYHWRFCFVSFFELQTFEQRWEVRVECHMSGLRPCNEPQIVLWNMVYLAQAEMRSMEAD